MKKILFVNYSLNMGGVEKSLIELLNHIDYSKYTVDLHILRDEKELVNDVNSNVNISFINTNGSIKFVKYLYKHMDYLNSLLKRNFLHKIFVHAMYHLGKLFESLFLITKPFETNYDTAIAYNQGYVVDYVWRKIKANYKVVFYHQGHMKSITNKYKKFDNIIAVSGSIKEKIETSFPLIKDKVTVINNLLDCKKITELSLETNPFAHDSDRIIVTVGRLSKEKGLDIAIDACNYLVNVKKICHLKWYIVGGGIEKNRLMDKIQSYQLTNHVFLTGSVHNPYPYMKNCDIYVQPSYVESYCLTISEAKILDKPIISTRTIGANSLIIDGQTGILCDIDYLDMANKIEDLMGNDNLYDTIVENIKKIDFGKINRTNLEAIDKLLGR